MLRLVGDASFAELTRAKRVVATRTLMFFSEKARKREKRLTNHLGNLMIPFRYKVIDSGDHRNTLLDRYSI